MNTELRIRNSVVLGFGIILAASIAGALVFTAQAAKSIPGEVPKLEPLQPPPFDVAPNLSHNIQDQGQVAPGLPPPSSNTTSGGASAGNTSGTASGINWLLWLGIVVPILFLLGWRIWRFLKNSSEQGEE